jgi:hypothetical protein
LPVQVRDSVLAEHERVNLAAEDVNRGFQIEQLEKSLENGSAALPYGKIAPSALLQRLARKQPYYKRNQAHICSFFVRGECDRGSTCPYRFGFNFIFILLAFIFYFCFFVIHGMLTTVMKCRSVASLPIRTSRTVSMEPMILSQTKCLVG